MELAAGEFPYNNCKTDFEVLSSVLTADPPSLPKNQQFDELFVDFINQCLTKNVLKRPKYKKLMVSEKKTVVNLLHKTPHTSVCWILAFYTIMLE